MLMIAGLMFGVATVQANEAGEYSKATQALCEKMKQCAIEQLNAEAEGVPQAMKDMVIQSMQGMCVSMASSFEPGLKQHELYQPAKACMQSMTALSCEQIMAMEDDTTKECQDYEKAIEAHEAKKGG